MDCRLSAALLPCIWVIEALALSNQIDISLLLDLLEKFPQTSDDLGRHARELVSFRILENFLSQGAQSNYLASSSRKIALDQSESCEDVLQRILLETPASNLKAAGPEMWKWDVQSFIARKRSTLDKHALQQLKDAILKGGHYFLASLKEQSGLPFGNQPESGLVVDVGKPDGIMHRFEGTVSNPRSSEDNCQLISPVVKNGSYLMHRDNPGENSSPVKHKGCSTSKILSSKSGKYQIISEDGDEGHKELSKKYENDIIHCKHGLGGKLSSSVVNRSSVDTSGGQCSEIERSLLERSTNFQATGTDGPPEDDNNECNSLRDIDDADEVLQSLHCDTEFPKDKSGDEHAQQIEIREAKGDKEGLCGPRSSEDVDRFEPHVEDHVKNGEGERMIEVRHCDSGLPNDKYDHEHGQSDIREAKNDEESFSDLKSTEERDKFDPHGKANVPSEREEGMHIGCDGQSKNSRHCSATDRRDLNMLADVWTGVNELSQVLGSMGQKGPPGDVEFTSSKGLLGHDKEMHRKEQVCNHNAKQDREDGNAGDTACFLEQKTSSGCKDGFEQEIHRNVTDLSDAEVVVSGDSDGCLDERTDIATKKIAFLSSQCSFSQGSVDCTELNVCVKCNKGGDLKVCSTNSCRLVVHESCSGSHMSFSARGEFHCPFCAYSQAISEYINIKKKVSLARKNFETFVCLGARKELKKQPRRSYRSKQHHLEHYDGLYGSIDPNNQENGKHINNHMPRRKLEYQEAGCSTLSSGDNSPSRGETVDATNGEAHHSNKYKREMKKMRPMPQATGAHGQSEMAASAIPRNKGEDASDKDPRKHSMRVQKHKRQHTDPDIPHVRRKKVSWTVAEEEKLKEGMRIFCTPHERNPWKKILQHGAAVFVDGRTTMDLKDKWRNLCRASRKL